MTAGVSEPGHSAIQRIDPLSASIEISLSLKRRRYCLVPLIVVGTVVAYSALPFPTSTPATFHSVAPVFLSSATTGESSPPGPMTRRPPSTSGDSANPHPPAFPPKSSTRFFDHSSLPVAASRQASVPFGPRT